MISLKIPHLSNPEDIRSESCQDWRPPNHTGPWRNTYQKFPQNAE